MRWYNPDYLEVLWPTLTATQKQNLLRQGVWIAHDGNGRLKTYASEHEAALGPLPPSAVRLDTMQWLRLENVPLVQQLLQQWKNLCHDTARPLQSDAQEQLHQWVHRARQIGLDGEDIAVYARASLTGIGIVVGVLGFAGMLYAESLDDDLNEVFLKRSYWGNGERSEGKFAASEEPQNKSDAEAMIRWAQRGLAAEVDGFNALSVGVKATLTWHSNYVSANVLEARIEASAGDENHRVAYKLIPSSTSAPPQTDGAAPMTPDKDSGHYVFSLKLPLDAPSWKAA